MAVNDIFDGGITGQLTDLNTIHGIAPETLEENAQYAIHRWSFQGDMAFILDLKNKHYCNELVTEDPMFSLVEGVNADVVIIGMSIDKREANRAILTITTKAFFRGYEAGIDFEVVSKDIHYWRQLCTNDKPDLKIIGLWEQMKDNPETIEKYYAYKYVDSSGNEAEIPDNTATRTLAGMMMRGVESYNEYIPTLTISYNLAKHPNRLLDDYEAGALLGRIMDSPSELLLGSYGAEMGFDTPIGDRVATYNPVDTFWEMFDSSGKIICTADQMRCNSDGSYTITRCFSKFRQIEEELYIGGSGTYGPYDEGTSGGGGE